MARTNQKSKLSGFEDFDRLLKNLGPRVGNRVLQNAVTSSVRVAAKEVKAAAPRSTTKRSRASKMYGFLVKNIRVIRLKRVERGQRAARVDTGKSFWGVFYELGTRYQPARPWFAPAFERARQAMIDNLAKRLKIGIEKEAKKLRGNRIK